MLTRFTLRVAAFALLLGCSTTSTVVHVSEPDIEGDIVGGSPESIFVELDSGAEVEVRRDEITSIDHPGNVHAGVGAGVLGYGILNIAVGAPECDRYGTAFCTGVFLAAAIGAGLIVWGLFVNGQERAGVEDKSRVSRPKAPKSRGRFPSWTTERPEPQTAPPQAAPPAAAPAVPSASDDTAPTEPASPKPALPAPSAPPKPPAPSEAPAPGSEKSGHGSSPAKSFPVEQ